MILVGGGCSGGGSALGKTKDSIKSFMYCDLWISKFKKE